MNQAEFEIRIEPEGYVFRADAQTTLMQAARAAGIELAASCRNGTCRTCLCMTNGKVSYLMEWPGVTREEKEQGYILPCVAYAESDLEIHGAAVRQKVK